MPTTDELRVMEAAHWACLLVVDGLPIAWTDSADLAQQADFFGDGRVIRAGLVPPRVELSIVPFEGKMRSHRAAFTILDRRAAEYGAAADYLADLFKAIGNEEPLAETLYPAATAPAGLYDMHVGTEAIGSAGERRRWPFVNGWAVGDHHIGADWEHGQIPTADVSEDPLTFAGRRVALYRVFRDHLTQPAIRTLGWRPWSEAVRRWWGVLTDSGSVDGARWTIEAAGPEALTERPLGTLTQEHGVTLRVPIVLSDDDGNDETRVGVYLRSDASAPNLLGTVREHYGTYLYTEVLSTSHATPSDLAGEVAAIIGNAIAATGTDGEFESVYGQTASMGLDGSVRIRIQDEVPIARRFAVMHLSMHSKVWQALGWAREQGELMGNPLDLEEEFLCLFDDPNELGFPSSPESLASTAMPPGPGYWTFIFSTAGVLIYDTDKSAEWDNQGADRVVFPLYQGGTGVLPANLGTGVVVELAPGDDPHVLHSGQLDRPVASQPGDVTTPYSFGGTPVDRQGVWFLVGPRRLPGQPEEFEDIQPVVASWPEGFAPGSVGPGVQPELLLTKWLDPQQFGIPRASMSETGDWTVLQNSTANLKAIPAFRLGYSAHSYERPERALQRLLYSTGASSGWTGQEGDPGATFDTTPNEPSTFVPATFDGEIADLGLAIPKELIANPLEWAAEFDKLPDGEWRKFRMLIHPGFTTNQLFEGLFAFYGLSWSLHGGRYGVRAMTESFTLEDVEVAITQAQKQVDPDRIGDNRTRQELRVMQPINTFKVENGYDCYDATFRNVMEIRATDRGARYRARGHEYTAKAYGILNTSGFRDRASQIARFYEKRHFLLRDYPVKARRPGMDIWPGTIVSITEPRAVSPDGTYGIETHVGMVTRISDDMGIRGNAPGMRIDVFVQQDSARTPRLCAPSALVQAYDNGTPKLLHVDDNWLSVEDEDWLDANGFLPPSSYSDPAADIDIKCLSYDGYEWIESFTAVCTGVTATAGACRLTLSAAGITGTFYEDMVNVVVPREFDAQSQAWPLALLATIGDEDGEFGVGPTDSSRWHT